MPAPLSPSAAKKANFNGPVFHSSEFAQQLDGLSCTSNTEGRLKSIVIVGGGKSAQEQVISAVLGFFEINAL